ncbi:hypothetical protein ACFOYW_18585 [Gryllotalpicola reticulitermitis]|uniref:Uncharacterized protein n=1 Tax=Gryllotalpicola reticulitermitis TaxID=1184153 RepID=A0ABV8QAK2_9MICO
MTVIRDTDRCSFDAFGEVHPFENTAAYEARRLRDRLTSGNRKLLQKTHRTKDVVAPARKTADERR